jgi:hypothetical protein
MHQGVRPAEKVVVLSIHDGLVCEHLSEAVLHSNLKISCESRLRGNAAIGPFEPLKSSFN